MSESNRLGPPLDEGKRLGALIGRYVRLELASKLSQLLAVVVQVGVLLVFGAVLLFCVCMFCVRKVEQLTGDEALSFALVGVALLVLMAVVVGLKRVLFLRPIVRKLMRIFFPRGEGPLDGGSLG